MDKDDEQSTFKAIGLNDEYQRGILRGIKQMQRTIESAANKPQVNGLTDLYLKMLAITRALGQKYSPTVLNDNLQRQIIRLNASLKVKSEQMVFQSMKYTETYRKLRKTQKELEQAQKQNQDLKKKNQNSGGKKRVITPQKPRYFKISGGQHVQIVPNEKITIGTQPNVPKLKLQRNNDMQIDPKVKVTIGTSPKVSELRLQRHDFLKIDPNVKVTIGTSPKVSELRLQRHDSLKIDPNVKVIENRRFSIQNVTSTVIPPGQSRIMTQSKLKIFKQPDLMIGNHKKQARLGIQNVLDQQIKKRIKQTADQQVETQEDIAIKQLWNVIDEMRTDFEKQAKILKEQRNEAEQQVQLLKKKNQTFVEAQNQLLLMTQQKYAEFQEQIRLLRIERDNLQHLKEDYSDFGDFTARAKELNIEIEQRSKQIELLKIEKQKLVADLVMAKVTEMIDVIDDKKGIPQLKQLRLQHIGKIKKQKPMSGIRNPTKELYDKLTTRMYEVMQKVAPFSPGRPDNPIPPLGDTRQGWNLLVDIQESITPVIKLMKSPAILNLQAYEDLVLKETIQFLVTQGMEIVKTAKYLAKDSKQMMSIDQMNTTLLSLNQESKDLYESITQKRKKNSRISPQTKQKKRDRRKKRQQEEKRIKDLKNQQKIENQWKRMTQEAQRKKIEGDKYKVKQFTVEQEQERERLIREQIRIQQQRMMEQSRLRKRQRYTPTPTPTPTPDRYQFVTPIAQYDTFRPSISRSRNLISQVQNSPDGNTFKVLVEFLDAKLMQMDKQMQNVQYQLQKLGNALNSDKAQIYNNIQRVVRDNETQHADIDAAIISIFQSINDIVPGFNDMLQTFEGGNVGGYKRLKLDQGITNWSRSKKGGSRGGGGGSITNIFTPVTLPDPPKPKPPTALSRLIEIQEEPIQITTTQQQLMILGLSRRRNGLQDQLKVSGAQRNHFTL